MLMNLVEDLIGLLRCDGDLVPVAWPLKDEPERELLLIEVQTRGNPLYLFRQTYAGELNSLQEKLAEKVFGYKVVPVSFGVFINPETRQLEFAFCRSFAEYNPRTKSVERNDIDEVLLAELDRQTMERIDWSSGEDITVPWPRPPYVPPGQPIPEQPQVVMYGVPSPPAIALYAVFEPQRPQVVKYGIVQRPLREIIDTGKIQSIVMAQQAEGTEVQTVASEDTQVHSTEQSDDGVQTVDRQIPEPKLQMGEGWDEHAEEI